MLNGRYDHTFDSEGRIIIPSGFRRRSAGSGQRRSFSRSFTAGSTDRELDIHDRLRNPQFSGDRIAENIRMVGA